VKSDRCEKQSMVWRIGIANPWDPQKCLVPLLRARKWLFHRGSRLR